MPASGMARPPAPGTVPGTEWALYRLLGGWYLCEGFWFRGTSSSLAGSQSMGLALSADGSPTVPAHPSGATAQVCCLVCWPREGGNGDSDILTQTVWAGVGTSQSESLCGSEAPALPAMVSRSQGPLCRTPVLMSSEPPSSVPTSLQCQ